MQSYLLLVNKNLLYLFYFLYKIYFSDVEHQQSDWYGIHEKICQSLIPLRIPQPFLPSEEERRKRNLEIRNKKVKYILAKFRIFKIIAKI